MMFLFYQHFIYDETGYKEETIELRPGLYDIECFGAQGGHSYTTRFGRMITLYEGGPGSYAHAKIKVTHSNISLKVEIGDQGNQNSGGQKDGGTPYIHTPYFPGGGGASSRVSLGNTPLVVAAGGSGASTTHNGAPGGGNNTCIYKERRTDDYFETSDTKYMRDDRYGGNGQLRSNPGSGGGGGYLGGKGGCTTEDIYISSVGVSGTSFISNDEMIVFSEVFNGSSRPNNLNGRVTIKSEYVCIDNCSNCENGETCLECDQDHVLYEGKCEFTDCPDGYFEDNKVCKPIINGTLIYNGTGYKRDEGVLRPGLYDIECFGAQGGNYFLSPQFFYPGGYGSYSHAKIKVTDHNLLYRVEIGEQGKDNHDSTNKGQPDGGSPSFSSNGYESGGGGGSSRVVLNERLSIIAAGGSGASSDFGGAFGGGNKTYFYQDPTQYNLIETSDAKYMSYFPNDRNGGSMGIKYGSGGGGGHQCGIGGFQNNNNNINPSSIGVSGTSFISIDESIVFSEIKSGKTQPHYRNGLVTIRSEYTCIDNCSNCENNLTCVACDSSHVLYDGKCELTKCPIGYINYQGVCKQCPDGQFSKGNSCVDSCGAGYFNDTTKKACIVCSDPNCNQCSTGKDICTQCNNNHNSNGTHCVSNCPSGFYPSNGRCLECEVNCSTCSNRGTCTSCKPEFYLKGTQCVESCGDGYYQNSTLKDCMPCSVTNCSKCDTNVGTCKKCSNEFVLFNNNCSFNQCPPGYFNDANICQSCGHNCKKCSSRYKCDECISIDMFADSNGNCTYYRTPSYDSLLNLQPLSREIRKRKKS